MLARGQCSGVVLGGVARAGVERVNRLPRQRLVTVAACREIPVLLPGPAAARSGSRRDRMHAIGLVRTRGCAARQCICRAPSPDVLIDALQRACIAGQSASGPRCSWQPQSRTLLTDRFRGATDGALPPHAWGSSAAIAARGFRISRRLDAFGLPDRRRLSRREDQAEGGVLAGVAGAQRSGFAGEGELVDRRRLSAVPARYCSSRNCGRRTVARSRPRGWGRWKSIRLSVVLLSLAS